LSGCARCRLRLQLLRKPSRLTAQHAEQPDRRLAWSTRSRALDPFTVFAPSNAAAKVPAKPWTCYRQPSAVEVCADVPRGARQNHGS
jgi:hypothetical protein